MLALSTFPLAATGYPLPDAPLRGCTAEYLLPSPTDRFLPFVLTRPLSTTRRLDCARVVHADTGALIQELDVTPLAETPSFGLAYEKRVDLVSGLEHYLYFGARVPDLELPCGVPLRLVVDEFTSVRFEARTDLSNFLLLEWHHDGPLGGLPYGAGLRQRLYVEGADLRYGPPRDQREETTDGRTGEVRVDFLALTRTATFTVPPVAYYVAQALHHAKAHRYHEAGGEAVRVTDVRQQDFDQDACQVLLTVTVEKTDVLVARACPAPLPAIAPPGNYEPRPWRCGDPSDTAPDWQQDRSVSECEQDENPDWQPTGVSECEIV